MPKVPKPRMTGIETGPMSLPKMDRPSVAFAWFLDNIVVGEDTPHFYFECALCGDLLCRIENNDTLRVLLNTALAHDCTSHP